MASPIKLSPLVAPFTIDATGLKQLDAAGKASIALTKKIADGMVSSGRVMTAGITMPILGAGIASAKFAMEFNKGMANVASLMPGQTQRVIEMKKQVQDLAMESGLATEDLTKGLYQTISAFGDAGDPVAKLAIAARAAKAGLATAEEGLNLLSATTLAYGDTSEAALKKVSDLSLLTVRLGKTTFPELNDAIGKVAAKGKALGVSQEEVFATFATLSGVVGNTSEVSTQFAGILGGLIKPTQGMEKMTKKLGYASSSAMVQELGFTKTLQVLKQESGGSIDKLGKLFESKEALTSITALLGEQSGTYIDKLGQMQKASGATEAALNEQENGINKTGNEFEKTKQKMMVTAQRIGERLLPMFDRLMEKFEPIINAFLNMSDSQLKFYTDLATSAAKIGPILLVFGKLSKAFGAIRDMSLLAGAASRGMAVDVATAGTNAKTASGNLTKMSKGANAASAAMPLLASALVGWEIGGILNSAMEDMDKFATDIENRVARGSVAMQSENLDQLRERSKMLSQELKKQEGLGYSLYRLAGQILPGESKSQNAYRAMETQWSEVESRIKVKLGEEIAKVQRNSDTMTSDTRPVMWTPNGTGQAVDLNIKIDAPEGARVGVNSKGAKPKVKGNAGLILAPGAI